jgi:hypothetical protein
MDLRTDVTDRIARETVKKQDEELRTALRTNAWSVFPILDYVIAQPEPSVSQDTGHFRMNVATKVRRYESPAPPVSESSIKGKQCSVQRWTKPLYEKLHRERPEAFVSP